jgi:hypothetical protein
MQADLFLTGSTAVALNGTVMFEAGASALPYTALHRPALPHSALHCPTPPYTALHCHTLHHTASHCNTVPFSMNGCLSIVRAPSACELLSCATEDRVAQIFYAAIPVLNTVFSGKCAAHVPFNGAEGGKVMLSSRGGGVDDDDAAAATVGQAAPLASPPAGSVSGRSRAPLRSPQAVAVPRVDLVPELRRLLQALSGKLASANARTSDIASQVRQMQCMRVWFSVLLCGH